MKFRMVLHFEAKDWNKAEKLFNKVTKFASKHKKGMISFLERLEDEPSNDTGKPEIEVSA